MARQVAYRKTCSSETHMRPVYAVLALAGTVIPWIFFSQFVARNGPDIAGFIAGGFANPVAAGFSADLLLSALTFWIWSGLDARREGVAGWWIVLPATLAVGLSLAMPLYLIMRMAKRPAISQPS